MMNLILLLVAIFIAYKVYENAIKFGCKCDNCGKNIKCDDEFCIYCGAKNGQNVSYVNMENERTENYQSQSQNTTFQTEEKQKIHYNYYDVLDDLDGIVVSLMAKVAKSDGIITSEEAKYISERYLELAKLTNKNEDVIEIYEEIFNREKNNFDNIQNIANKLRDLDEAPKAYVLKILTELSGIDNHNEILNKIKEAMKFENNTQQSFYEILNSKPTDDWETIKHNYKQLVKEYHYDKLASKNLPKDLIEYAENRLKEINEAYDALKKLKNQ